MTDMEATSTYIGSDDEVIGYEIRKYLFKSMGGKGKVVHIDGVPAAITAQERKNGFERALKEFPGIELLASQPGKYRRLPAVQVFENLMQRFPRSTASSRQRRHGGRRRRGPRGGRSRRQDEGGRHRRAFPTATAAIDAGKMFASADFSGHDQGYLAVTAAVRNLRGQAVPKEIELPVVIVDKGERRGLRG